MMRMRTYLCFKLGFKGAWVLLEFLKAASLGLLGILVLTRRLVTVRVAAGRL